MARRKEADMLTKEQTKSYMEELLQLRVKTSEVGKELGLTYFAPYAWLKGKARAPKELELLLMRKKAEAHIGRA